MSRALLGRAVDAAFNACWLTQSQQGPRVSRSASASRRRNTECRWRADVRPFLVYCFTWIGVAAHTCRPESYPEGCLMPE